MIIDFHTHIFIPAVLNSRDSYFSDPHFSLLYKDPKSRMVDHRALLEAMDAGGVDCAVAMGFPWVTEAHAREQNEYFSHVSADTGGRILPFGTIARDEKNIKERVKEVKALGLKGIGEAGFYDTGMGEEGEVYLRRLMEASTEEGLIVCLHVNEPVGHQYPGKYDPELSRVYKLVKDYPDVKIVLAHWGGGILFYELMKEVKEAFTNVYYDTAASPFLYDKKIYQLASEITGGERILFGSDFPLINFQRYRDEVEAAVPDREIRAKILGQNGAELLGL